MTRVGPPGEALAVTVMGEGPPVLLLHGFTGSSAGWSAIVESLQGRHRVVVPDLLGHGRSDAPHDPAPYVLSRQAAVLRSVLADLEAEPATVVGYSMGARLALSLAVEHPRSVSALLLESPSAGLSDPIARDRRRDDDERWARLLEEEGIVAFVDAWEAQPIFASQTALPGERRARVRAERLGQDAQALAASLRGAGQGAMEPLQGRLPHLRVPTLVIAGTLDTPGLERAREVAGLVPGAGLEIVAGTGHAPHLERPELVIVRVLAFLAASQPIAATPR